jgi:hypothetical protein
MKLTSPRSRRVALVGALLLHAAVAIVFTVPPADQYEIAIHTAYPIYFWVLLIGAIFTGAAAIATSAVEQEGDDWIFGAVLMLLANGVVLLLPLIRGYYMYGRSDQLTHLGYVRNIVETGGFGSNIYPPTHLLALLVADATGAELTTVSMLLPVVFSGLFFGAMVSLLVTVFESRKRILFGLPFAILPVLGVAHTNFRPFDLSVMLLPLTLYTLFKGRGESAIAVRIAFVIVLVANALYHPLTAAFIIGLLALYGAVRYLLVSDLLHRLPAISLREKVPTNAVSLSAFIFVVWYSNFVGIILRFEEIYSTVFGTQQGNPPVARYADTAAQTQIALIDLIEVFTFRFGDELLLFALGFACVPFAALCCRYNADADSISSYGIVLWGAVSLFAVAGLGFLTVDLIVAQKRPFRVAKLCGAVLAGQALYLPWRYVDWSRQHAGVYVGYVTSVGMIFVLLAIITVITVYPFAPAAQANQQVTEMEYDGSAWVSEHTTTSTPVLNHGMSYRRFYHAQNGWIPGASRPVASPPDHYNYTEHRTLGASYSGDRYLLVTRRSRITYPELFAKYPSEWRYTPQDFARLEADTSVVRVYDNGEMTVYRVTGLSGRSSR